MTKPVRRPSGSPRVGFELRPAPPEAAELLGSVLSLLLLTMHALAPLVSDDSPQTRGRAGLALAALKEVLHDLRTLSSVLGTEHRIAAKAGWSPQGG